jgi:hypothetical protein
MFLLHDNGILLLENILYNQLLDIFTHVIMFDFEQNDVQIKN